MGMPVLALWLLIDLNARRAIATDAPEALDSDVRTVIPRRGDVASIGHDPDVLGKWNSKWIRRCGFAAKLPLFPRIVSFARARSISAASSAGDVAVSLPAMIASLITSSTARAISAWLRPSESPAAPSTRTPVRPEKLPRCHWMTARAALASGRLLGDNLVEPPSERPVEQFADGWSLR